MANQFNDRLGRTWDLSLTLGHLTKVRKSFGIELGKILADEKALLSLLFDDPENLGRVLYTIVEQQAVKAGVEPEGFAEGFDGPALDAARIKLMESIANFTQPEKIATAVVQSLTELLGERATVTANQIRSLTQTALRTLSDTVTNSVASAA